MTLPLFLDTSPAVSRRIVHLDLKGVPPTFPRLLDLLTLFKRMHFTAVMMEWEDCFPWTINTRLRAPYAYTPDEVRNIARLCKELELEIIPLVQSLGHSENVLRLPEYQALREVPERSDVFHPLHPDSPGLVEALVRDVLELLPDVRYFHLGGDEVYTLGAHPSSRDLIEREGIAALYLRQLDPTLSLLDQRGVRPLLWHDEVVSWDVDQIRSFVHRVDLMVWGYTGDPRNPETYHHRLPHLQKLHSLGATLWGATSFKGADGPHANVPDTHARAKATQGWVELTPGFELQGIVCTGWSRYASGRIQVNPIEGALDSLLYAARLLHNGKAPDSLEICENWLMDQPESADFIACRDCLCRLTRHVDKAWEWIRQLEEQLTHLTFEPERAHSGIEGMLYDLLCEDIHQSEEAGYELETLLRDMMAAPLPEFYRKSRVLPLEAARNRIQHHPLLSPSVSKPVPDDGLSTPTPPTPSYETKN